MIGLHWKYWFAALSLTLLGLSGGLAIPAAAQGPGTPTKICPTGQIVPVARTCPLPETRIVSETSVPPPATLADVDWLIGQWSGTGIGGNPAHESWLPPVGTTMVGTFIQEDGESGIQFSEHMYLMEEEGSLVMRLKHFNADLTAWEDKDGMVTFRLIELEPCGAYFRGLTLRCTTEEEGSGGLIVAVKMQSGGELNFRFSRQRAEAQASAASDSDCVDTTTRGYEECFSARSVELNMEHQRYLEAALTRYADEPLMVDAIRESETAFEQYAAAECRAVWKSFGSGSIRTAEHILCRNDLQRRRTHTIWENWLTYADSTPPMLPEPKLTE